MEIAFIRNISITFNARRYLTLTAAQETTTHQGPYKSRKELLWTPVVTYE
jgi:hypothetical protein